MFVLRPFRYIKKNRYIYIFTTILYSVESLAFCPKCIFYQCPERLLCVPGSVAQYARPALRKAFQHGISIRALKFQIKTPGLLSTVPTTQATDACSIATHSGETPYGNSMVIT